MADGDECEEKKKCFGKMEKIKKKAQRMEIERKPERRVDSLVL